jgi:hypothetical protein
VGVTKKIRLTGHIDVPADRLASVEADQAAFDAHQARVKASDWGRISAGIPRNYDIEHMD